jgi:hypothetical protein
MIGRQKFGRPAAALGFRFELGQQGLRGLLLGRVLGMCACDFAERSDQPTALPDLLASGRKQAD